MKACPCTGHVIDRRHFIGTRSQACTGPAMSTQALDLLTNSAVPTPLCSFFFFFCASSDWPLGRSHQTSRQFGCSITLCVPHLCKTPASADSPARKVRARLRQTYHTFVNLAFLPGLLNDCCRLDWSSEQPTSWACVPCYAKLWIRQRRQSIRQRFSATHWASGTETNCKCHGKRLTKWTHFGRECAAWS